MSQTTGDAGTISMIIFRAVCGGIQAAGADVSALLADLSIDPAALADADGRIPVELAFQVFAEAPRLTGDESFGLHAGASIPSGALEVLDYAIRSSRTAGEALHRTARYYAIVDSGTGLTIEESGDLLRVVSKNRSGLVAPRTVTELSFATIVARGRELTGRDVPLRAVDFIHAPPSSLTEHERFFGAPVRFSQAFDQLLFDRAWAEAPLLTADPALSSLMERFLRSLLEKLPRADGFLDRARHAIAEGMHGCEPTLEETAEKLSLSARTLQRRLKALATSHQDLVDAVRRDLAVQYLVNQRIAIGEVAYLLGFSDPSTFHRAFKRWTGTTPKEYRKRLEPRPLKG